MEYAERYVNNPPPVDTLCCSTDDDEEEDMDPAAAEPSPSESMSSSVSSSSRVKTSLKVLRLLALPEELYREVSDPLFEDALLRGRSLNMDLPEAGCSNRGLRGGFLFPLKMESLPAPAYCGDAPPSHKLLLMLLLSLLVVKLRSSRTCCCCCCDFG